VDLHNLKVVLIAAIIALHAVLGYAGTVEAWTYTAVREVTLTPAVEITLIVRPGRVLAGATDRVPWSPPSVLCGCDPQRVGSSEAGCAAVDRVRLIRGG
jgi:hypothetical protein